MGLGAKVFISGTIGAGVGVLLYGFTHASWPEPVRFICYLLLVVLASQLKIVLAGVNGTMSLSFLLILLGVVELSATETLLLACLATLVQTLWHSRKITLIQIAFNLAQMANAVALCYLVYHHSAAWLGETAALRLIAAALTYFLANTIPVAVVISITEHQPFHRLWAEHYFWSFPFYLAGGTLAGVVNWFNRYAGWQATFLTLPVIYLMYRSYRLYADRLEEEKKHAEEISGLHWRTIEALALAIQAKDQSTHDHLQRVRVYAVEIGKELGLSGAELEALRAASLLHDIGKLAVPEHIINKPSRLSPAEFEKMKIHPRVGAEILERVDFPYPVVPIVRAHHERWDGSGYPDGLKGEQIPTGARILAAVDYLDALASDRQYRRALPLKQAVSELCAQAGKYFDPRIVAVLERKYPELERLIMPGALPWAMKLVPPARAEFLAVPAAGLENQQGQTTEKADFLISIVAAGNEAQALLELSTDLGTSLNLYETVAVIALRLRKLIPYQTIVLYVLRGGKLVPEYAVGNDADLFASREIPLGEGLAGWVAQHRQPIINGDPCVEPGCYGDRWKPSSHESALAVPLLGVENLVGVLVLYQSGKDVFSADHLRFLLATSDKIGACVENAIKYQAAVDLSTTDHLTGLPNARSLLIHLNAEIARCQRTGDRLAALVCDLDGFKQINDRFGHFRGNDVLKLFGAKLRHSCREYDYVSRLGGDEFVVIAPALGRDSVQEMCMRLSCAAGESSREVCGESMLSASIGVAFFPDDAVRAEQLLMEADNRMYSIKRAHQRERAS